MMRTGKGSLNAHSDSFQIVETPVSHIEHQVAAGSCGLNHSIYETQCLVDLEVLIEGDTLQADYNIPFRFRRQILNPGLDGRCSRMSCNTLPQLFLVDIDSNIAFGLHYVGEIH